MYPPLPSFAILIPAITLVLHVYQGRAPMALWGPPALEIGGKENPMFSQLIGASHPTTDEGLRGGQWREASSRC